MSLEYDSNVNRIKGIQFGILSPQEIRDRSVAEITTQETYTGNEPVVGGLFDPRMGVSEYGKICPTDGLDSRECPGYFGHIELARPVFHIQFLQALVQRQNQQNPQYSFLKSRHEDGPQLLHLDEMLL